MKGAVLSASETTQAREGALATERAQRVAAVESTGVFDTGDLNIGRIPTGRTDDETAALTDRLEPCVSDVEGRELHVVYEEMQDSPE